MAEDRLAVDEVDVLMRLLATDTRTPMETGAPGDLRQAQQVVADAAAQLGFVVCQWAPAAEAVLDEPGVPEQILWHAQEQGVARFLDAQPNLVLRLGQVLPSERTLVFNCHLDTVSGDVPVDRRGDMITGRGAVDAKGQIVAVLAGVRAAFAADPALPQRIAIVLQAVGGEEGGAMGWYGSRVLARTGPPGRLIVVAEPTSMGVLDQTTASMTARVGVRGQGATDDSPESGHNATIVLAAVADHLVRHLAPRLARLGAVMCVAGVHTGQTHNRVYGEGELLLNFAYADLAVAEQVTRLAEQCFAEALDRFERDYRGIAIADLTVRDLRTVCRWRWLKAGLPVLANRDAEMERVLAAAGFARHDGTTVRPFTCDAMWFAAPGRYTAVLGSGDLARNRAHADGEFVDLRELAGFGDGVARLVTTFAAHVSDGEP